MTTPYDGTEPATADNVRRYLRSAYGLTPRQVNRIMGEQSAMLVEAHFTGSFAYAVGDAMIAKYQRPT